MRPTLFLQMPKRGKRIPIKLVSTANTGYFYTTTKNVAKKQDKMELIKFDPIVRRRVIFKERKIR